MGPAVVEKHCLALVEDWGDLLDPAGAEFCLDRFHDRGVRCGDFRDLVFDAELVQQRAGGGHQGVGDFVLVGVECSRIHHSAAGGTTAGGLGDCNAVACGDVLYRLVDQCGDLRLGRGRRQAVERTAADRFLSAAAQQDLGFDVRGPGCGQAPRGREVLADKRRLQACAAEELAQAGAHGLG